MSPQDDTLVPAFLRDETSDTLLYRAEMFDVTRRLEGPAPRACTDGSKRALASPLEDLHVEALAEPILFDLQVVAGLKIEPESLRGTKVSRQP